MRVLALTLVFGSILGCAAAEPADGAAAGKEAGVTVRFPDVPYTWTATTLPKPEGKVVRVKDVRGLRGALGSGMKDTTVLLADGEYPLDRPITLARCRNVSVRSESGNRDKVILKGTGMAHRRGKRRYSGITWAASSRGLEIASVTIRDFPFHGVHISGKDVHLFNCRFVDMGQQLVKVNAVGEQRPEGGRMEYCLIEYTDRLWGGNYTQGISIVNGRNWVVRHCVFRNIRGAKGAGMGGPAILMWGGSKHMAAVGNVMINCDCGIAFGIGRPRRGPYHLEDGLIAGNVFVRTEVERGSDHGIAVASAKNVRVVQNTVWNPSPKRGGINWSIEYRFDCDDLLFANNLSQMRILKRNGEQTNVELKGNVVSTEAAWFEDLKRHDLHLTAKAAGALGKAVALKKDPLRPVVDVDGEPVPTEGGDVGADQRRP
jgi:hypothetical protein